MPPAFRIDIDLGRAPSVLASLRRLDAVKVGLRAAAFYFKGQLDNYPPQVHISRKQAFGETFSSDIQRKAFFAMLDSGEITVPYKRRGAGGLAGKFSVNERDGGLAQEIANNASYARYVIDDRRQSRMMRLIGWKTIRDVWLAERDAVRRIILDHVRRSVK